MIVFDSRRIKNTITGSKPFSIQQLANDTNGLLEALRIQKTNVLRYSFGSLLVQQFAIMYLIRLTDLPLLLHCIGRKESMPQPSFSLTTLLSDILNKSLNNVPVSHGEKKITCIFLYKRRIDKT